MPGGPCGDSEQQHRPCLCDGGAAADAPLQGRSDPPRPSSPPPPPSAGPDFARAMAGGGPQRGGSGQSDFHRRNPTTSCYFCGRRRASGGCIRVPHVHLGPRRSLPVADVRSAGPQGRCEAATKRRAWSLGSVPARRAPPPRSGLEEARAQADARARAWREAQREKASRPSSSGGGAASGLQCQLLSFSPSWLHPCCALSADHEAHPARVPWSQGTKDNPRCFLLHDAQHDKASQCFRLKEAEQRTSPH